MDNTDKPQENTSPTRSNSWDDYQDFISNIREFIGAFNKESLELTDKAQRFHRAHLTREEMTNQIAFINGKLVHIRITMDASEHRIDEQTLLKILPRQDAKKLSNPAKLSENCGYAMENIISDIKTIHTQDW
ncbi:conserved hypothetical protein [Vibrio crassostreae]|nr:conserved hypothetical protein [Vibrio crassostreae]CAK2947601.1 conserved hypothetical protein [Vibrio crassostreae]CAK3529517.1 conserved hypothetical protein [Vibrio crassostreae]